MRCVVCDKWILCIVKICVCYRVFVRDQSEFCCVDRITCMRILCEYFVTSARVLIIRIRDFVIHLHYVSPCDVTLRFPVYRHLL